MDVLVLVQLTLVLIKEDIVLQGFVRVVFRIDASDLFAHISHPRREVLEDIILRHIDHSMRIVFKNHSICIELLNRLETF